MNTITKKIYFGMLVQQLNIYEEIEDAAPQYMSTATLVRETSPKYILTFGYPTETYVQTLLEIRNSDGSNTTTTTSSTMSIPPNFFLVSLRQYSTSFNYLQNVVLIVDTL